jgi:hypothetical protein
MHANMEDIKDGLIAEVEGIMADLEAEQLVQFKSWGTMYMYARQYGKEYWSVPTETEDKFKMLMTLIRQFDEQIEKIDLPGALTPRFISRYYRMRSDLIIGAECLSVGVHPDKLYSPEERCSLARLRKVKAKLQLLTRARGIDDPAK